MEIKIIKTDEDLTHLALIGRLDLLGAEQVELKFTVLVVTGGKPALIDLSGLEFISSLGLKMFLSNSKALSNKGAKLVLLNPKSHVLEMLISVGFDKIIPIENDLDKALEILKQNQ